MNDQFSSQIWNVKKYLNIFRNKFIFAFTVFVVYALFLDDVDVFMIYSKKSRLNQLEKQKIELADKLKEIEDMQRVLQSNYSLEKFAREERFFHKADEDVFVIEYLDWTWFPVNPLFTPEPPRHCACTICI